ncbi:uncharacterized protein LOC131155800 [Malania oleifera]|uniref:uncharacterized protein LOC131155800 n=1 Tax=Malania oleifera TaxID=397392 RepID=UPI0025AE19C1|nr:uncharacterized protein LOC131155800 [Malania oleifera]
MSSLHATLTDSLCCLTFPFSSPSSSSLSSFSSLCCPSPRCSIRVKMSSPSLPPLPENGIVVGVGGLGLDYLAAVASYPKPDDKIRSTSLKVQGGGNVGNALTCAARLGLYPRIISKIADDTHGKYLLEDLKADGVDTSFLVVSKDGNSPMSYVIVDSQTKTRTCIHTPGHPPMIPEDLSPSSLFFALEGARLAYFDVRLPETALVVAREAARKNIPILIDAERKREGLDDLLNLASYVVCAEKFPQAWTEELSVPSALVSMLLSLPNVKFVIVTLGGDGCVMIERSTNQDQDSQEMDIDMLLDSLKQRKDDNTAIPTCLSSPTTKLSANGIGTVHGRLFFGTAERIPPSELIDTTGAGDAFVGAVLYAVCTGMPPEKMLPFAAQVAAAGCRALGARTGLPYRTDPSLAYFLQ